MTNENKSKPVIPLYFIETPKKDEIVTNRYYKIYYDYFNKGISCTVIGNKLTEEETRKLSQFGIMQYKSYTIVHPFVAQTQATIVFDKPKFVNFIVHYASFPGLIFSAFNENDAMEQLAAISKLFNENEYDIISTTLKNTNRISINVSEDQIKIELVETIKKEN